MGGTVYKRCDHCGRWVHRDETVLVSLAKNRRRSHKKYCDNESSLNPTPSYPIPRRICLFCDDGHASKQSAQFARMAAANETATWRSKP